VVAPRLIGAKAFCLREGAKDMLNNFVGLAIGSLTVSLFAYFTLVVLHALLG